MAESSCCTSSARDAFLGVGRSHGDDAGPLLSSLAKSEDLEVEASGPPDSSSKSEVRETEEGSAAAADGGVVPKSDMMD